MKKYILFILIIAGALSAQISKTGTTVAGFLKISPGARSTSMGGAFVSIADDISAMWWNPAGMAQLEGNQAVFTHSAWLAGITYNYGAVTIDLDNAGVLGLGMTFLSVGEMERTTEASPDGTGEFFDAGSFALNVSYARMLTEAFSFGATFKYIQESIFNMTSNGIAFDVGMLYETPFAGTRLGMSMTNYGGKLKLDGDDTIAPIDIYPDIPGSNEATTAHLSLGEYDIPLTFRVGLSNDIMENEQFRLTIATDAVIPNDNLIYANVGGEFAFKDLFFVRSGVRNLFLKDVDGGFTIGAGLNFEVQSFDLSFDYAYDDFGKLNNIQQFTLTLKF